MLISSICPKFSPNRPKAPTKEDNKTGLILVSNIRSRRYSPLSLQITMPFSNLKFSVIIIPVIIINTLCN
jgi:hypothetical protein